MITQGFTMKWLTENQGLVLFFCSFLALRSRDTAIALGKIKDYEIHLEEELFAG